MMQDDFSSAMCKLNNLAIEININCQGWPKEKKLHDLVENAVRSASVSAEIAYPEQAQLSLLFSDNREIQRLNNQFRGKNVPTNVLSFPQLEIKPGQSAGEILGDIAFALETIRAEAALENKSFDNHLTHLIVHGFLHLFGYDHMEENDAEIMEAHEISALAKLGIENPYLEQ